MLYGLAIEKFLLTLPPAVDTLKRGRTREGTCKLGATLSGSPPQRLFAQQIREQIYNLCNSLNN